MATTSKELKGYVKAVLEAKNIQKLPRTLAQKLDDYSSAEFFELTDKMQDIETAIRKICTNLTARDHKTVAETLKEESLDDLTLKRKALVHGSKIRRLAQLRVKFAEDVAKLESSIKNGESRIPYQQREKFNALLVANQQAIAERVESGDDLNDTDE